MAESDEGFFRTFARFLWKARGGFRVTTRTTPDGKKVSKFEWLSDVPEDERDDDEPEPLFESLFPEDSDGDEEEEEDDDSEDLDADEDEEEEPQQCEAETKDGFQCSRMAEPDSPYCWQHRDLMG